MTAPKPRCSLNGCTLFAAPKDPLCTPHGSAAKARADYEKADRTTHLWRFSKTKFERAVNTLIRAGSPVPRRWLDED